MISALWLIPVVIVSACLGFIAAAILKCSE